MFKRWTYALATTVMLSGCGASNTPEDVTQAFLQAAYSNDIDGLFEHIDIPADTEAADLTLVRGKLSAQLQRTEALVEANGGLDRIEVEPAKLSDNDTQAQVSAKVYFNNDAAPSKQERLRLKQIDGTWKVNI